MQATIEIKEKRKKVQINKDIANWIRMFMRIEKVQLRNLIVKLLFLFNCLKQKISH